MSDITSMEQDMAAVASRHSNEMYIIDIKKMTNKNNNVIHHYIWLTVRGW